MSVYLKEADTGKSELKKTEVADDDEWETDPDFVNDVSEKEQRWGSAIIVPDRNTGDKPSLADLRQQVSSTHNDATKKEYESGGKFSRGYGGEFGVEKQKEEAVEKEEEEKK